MKVLIVDDDLVSCELLSEVAEAGGYEVAMASDGEEGLAAYKALLPDVVISDIEMPGKNGLQLLGDIRKMSNDVIIVMETAYDKLEYAIESLRLRANNFLRKPLDPEDFLKQLRTYESAILERSYTEEILGMVESRSLTVLFENRLELVPRFVSQLIAEARHVLPGSDSMHIRLGLMELITNAVEHGNLGISYEDKAKAMEAGISDYIKLADQRLENPELAKRRVRVEFAFANEQCQWIIEDEGEGFDWRSVMDPREEEGLELSHGRGVFLSRFAFDSMEYNEKGNRVRVVKASQEDA